MTSKLIVNNIEADAGVSTITFGSEISASKITTSSGDFTVGTGASVYSPTTNVLALGTNSAERLRIASDGKIGINTTVLTEQLEVDGDIRVRNAVKFRDDNGDETGNISMGDDDNFTIQSFGTSGHITFDTGSSVTERLRITSGGRISINNTSGPTDIPGTAHDTVVVGNPTATGGGITLEVASGNNCGFQMYAQGSQPAARFLYLGSSNAAEIYTQNSGGTSESVRMTFKEDGNVSIANGNLVLASGHGIDFSATADGSGTSSSELLDDYEEGSWTPTAGNYVGTLSNVAGSYTKIGRIVYVQYYVTTSAFTDIDNATIGGLPYAPQNPGFSGNTSVENTGVVFDDNRLYLTWCGDGSSIAIEADRPIQGSTTTSGVNLRGSLTYVTNA